MRDLVRYPITQEEAVKMLRSEARRISAEGRIGDMRPMLLNWVSGILERMNSMEWHEYQKGLNP